MKKGARSDFQTTDCARLLAVRPKKSRFFRLIIFSRPWRFAVYREMEKRTGRTRRARAAKGSSAVLPIRTAGNLPWSRRRAIEKREPGPFGSGSDRRKKRTAAPSLPIHFQHVLHQFQFELHVAVEFAVDVDDHGKLRNDLDLFDGEMPDAGLLEDFSLFQFQEQAASFLLLRRRR